MALLLVKLLFVGLASLVAGDSTCPYAKYVAEKEVHTMCLPPNTSCTIVNKGVSQADQQLIVKKHNDVRNTVASGQFDASGTKLPPAADMRRMEWSPELATIAQAHANQCNTNFECSNCRSTEDFITGENLYYFYNPNQPPKTMWQDVINSWASGSKKMPSITYSTTRPGAFAQMIWGLTKYIGCGRTMFRGNPRTARFIDLYVCIYGPAGNYINQDIYEAGPPCSDCGYGESCCANNCTTPEQYPYLCQLPASRR